MEAVDPLLPLCRTPEGKIKVFCKGADTMILARLGNGDPYSNITRLHLVRRQPCFTKACPILGPDDPGQVAVQSCCNGPERNME